MDSLSKLAISIWTILLFGIGLFVAVLIWPPRFLGDPLYHPLFIQNDRSEQLILKTYTQTARDHNSVTIDSLVLQSGETLKIGVTLQCSEIDSTSINFDAIELFDQSKHPKLYKRKALAEFLLTIKATGCSTYLIR
ncbi:MAG: hypothetical protein QM762_18355 [Chryseolinea sp.]